MRPFLAPPAPAGLVVGVVPTFSVIVAAYNVAPYIGEALTSTFAQDPPPDEVIVVDDGSTDDIESAVAPFRDRITFVRQANGGESAAKNSAVRHATGDFVVILDADDVDLPGRLAALGDLAAARPDLDILATDCLMVRDGEILRRYHEPYNPFPVAEQRRVILRQNWIASPAVRRTAWLEVGGYDEAIRHGADWECWIRMILNGAVAGLVPEPLFRYRQRPGSLTAERVAILAGRVQVLTKTLGDPRLDTAERAEVTGALRVARRRLAREAVVRSDPRARSAAARVLVGRGQPVRERLWAASAFVAPGTMARRADQVSAGAPPAT